MALSAVDICNMALDHLKEDNISSIDPAESKVEVICARWYDLTRQIVLRKHPWNFSTKRVLLAKLVAAPEFGFAEQYELPSDFVRLVSIGEEYQVRDYQIEDNKILINHTGSFTADTLALRYIYDFENVPEMDPLFIDLLALELAIRVSYQITGNRSAGQALMQMLKELAPDAYAIDGQERPPIRIETSKFKRARMNGSRGNVASPYTLFEA